MAKFRKKPVVIEAVQFAGWNSDAPTFEENPEWLTEGFDKRTTEPGAVSANLLSPSMRRALLIRTLEGDHEASPGDWIIRGVKGELYPCKPDIFAMTYDAMESDAP